MLGYTESSYVDFEESKSVRDGKFLGLALDYVNIDEDEAKDLVNNWCEQVVAEMKA